MTGHADAVRLVPMTAAELPAWAEHSRAGFAAQQVAAGLLPAEEAAGYAAEQLARLLPDGVATPGHHLWTVHADDVPVGHLWVEVRDDADGRGAYVYDVEVAEQARGRGLGLATMLAGERAAAGLGARRIRLNVFGHNTVARRLYDALGYRVAATTMAKRLDGPEPSAAPAAPLVTLRPMTEERYAAFRPAREAAYAENLVGSGAFGERQARERAAADFDRLLPEGLATPGHRLWTGHAEDGAEVGFLWLHLTERRDGLHAFGYDLQVRADLRRHGYGRALVVAAASACRRQGVVAVGFSVLGSDAGARALLEQRGFTVAAESRVKQLSA